MILGNFIVRITEYLSRKKILFWVGLLFLFLFLGNGIRKLRISESIYSALPKGKSFQTFNGFIENKNISNQVVFSLAIADTTGTTDIAPVLQVFTDSLTRVSGKYLSAIISTRPDVDQEVYSYFFNNFPYLIDSSYYATIDNKLIADSIRSSVNASYRQLVGPGSAFLKKYILNDPLFITTDFFKHLRSSANKNIIVEDGIVYNANKTKALITSKTNFSSDNSFANVSLHEILVNFKDRWNVLHPKNAMDYFGTFEIAAENATQIKKDTRLTITITIVALLLILFIYYRKLTIPFYFILPPFFGGFFAVGIMGYINPEISAISLATGAVLLGIILDYSFHFFTHLRHTGSIAETIKDISSPLLTGSFTTITAFFALQFTNSVVLRDFGLFGALSLSGAAVFTLVCLPVVLKQFSFNSASIPNDPFTLKMPSFSRRNKFIGLGIIAVLTIVFLFSSNNIQFDGELENMSFHTDDLKLKEHELTGINSAHEKRIYFFASDWSYEKACEKNYELFQKLEMLRMKGEVINILSAGQFVIPEKIKREREKTWMNYWCKKGKIAIDQLSKTADSLGFSANAFVGFKEWINRENLETIEKDSLLKMVGMDNLVGRENNKTTFITTIIVNKDKRIEVEEKIRRIKGVEVFDRADVAASLLALVKNDFNYILILSACIVFFTLLLIYGRIELALFSFFPMLVSWIWIIGIAGFLGIKFNFVNVVISTFIFGLGDDYSIFMTDGLLHNYKYGKRQIGSYTSAILLSASCTIIGTGVLIFAKHPAIHSVALISVLGISCILFLSLVFQPILFELLVQGRVEKKKPPVPILEFLISVFEFSYWLIFCLCFYPVGILIVLLPFSRKTKAFFFNKTISSFSKSLVYLGFHVRKNILQIENLDIKKPSILIANHSSSLDVLLILMLNPRIIIFVKKWVYNSPAYGLFIRNAGYIFMEEGNEQNLDTIKKRIADGYSILIFPEGSRSATGEIGRFHKGAFYLAQQLNLDITPILIHGASYVLPKNDLIVKKGSLHVKVLPRIKSTDVAWGTSYQERAKNISRHFKKEHAIFKEEQDTASVLWSRVFNNYIFKGPVLEWYVKIKWKFESKNFEHYNRIIGNRNKIMDVGCGYGYLALYLHYKNENREIIGIDYDEEKIEIAKNVFDKNSNLNFVHANVKTANLGKQDVIFINDVLHYLPEADQLDFLERCNQALNENGILVIRDGITDFVKRHSTTKLTEFFSTRIFRFNKKESDFHFFSSDFIKSFAQKNNLQYEMEEQSKKTSNVLFVLRKTN